MGSKKSKKTKSRRKSKSLTTQKSTVDAIQVTSTETSLEETPFLSLAMMVKDEEEFLAEALHSVKGLVDEMVVVDTGSTDRTVEIAESFGARVSFYPWKQDFSDARNETIRQSRGEWVLILDADERVEIDPKLIPNLKKGLKKLRDQKPYVGLSVDVINIKLDGSVMNSLPSLRIFPTGGKMLYKNRVHNQLLPDDPKAELNINLCDFLKIKHLGYDPIVYERRKKSDRSLPLIQKMIEDEPNNMIYRFYEGREFYIKHQYHKAVESLEKAILGMLEGHHGYFAETLKTLISIYPRLKVDSEKIITFCDLGIERTPDQPDFWNFKGYELMNTNKIPEAIDALTEALKRLDNFELKEVSQSHPLMAQRPWRCAETLADLLWDEQRYQEAYNCYKRVFDTKPLSETGWPMTLNNICALAIEFNEQDHLLKYFERLLTQPKTKLDMFFFEIDRRIHLNQIKEAGDLLRWGRRRSRRVMKSEQFEPLCKKLQLDDLL